MTSTTIKYTDGTTKVFGQTGKAFTDPTFENGVLTITTYFNQVDQNGIGVSQAYSLDTTNPANHEFLFKDLAGRGGASVIKDALNATKDFADSVDEKGNTIKGAFTIVKNKIAELNEQKLSSRESGVGTKQPLTKTELAYARANGLDVESTEGYKAVTEWYEAISKDARKQLVKDISFNPLHELHIAYLEIDKEQYSERAARTQKAKDAAYAAAQSKVFAALGITE